LVALTYGTSSSAGDYYGYDSLGRQTLKIQQTGGINYQVAALYNLASGITSETYPSGRTISYSYDAAGRASSVTGNLGDGTNRIYSTGITYASAGQVKQEQFGTTYYKWV
jgi:YD repeat-containing protein